MVRLCCRAQASYRRYINATVSHNSEQTSKPKMSAGAHGGVPAAGASAGWGSAWSWTIPEKCVSSRCAKWGADTVRGALQTERSAWPAHGGAIARARRGIKGGTRPAALRRRLALAAAERIRSREARSLIGARAGRTGADGRDRGPGIPCGVPMTLRGCVPCLQWYILVWCLRLSA